MPGLIVDKAHNDILQVAVTNGLLGVLADYLILATLAVQFWRRRRQGWVAAMIAGLLAYEVALQAEFSWVPTAVPFWLFAAAALAFTVSPSPAKCAGEGRVGARFRLLPWQQTALMAVIIGVGAALAVYAVIPDLMADRLLYRAVRDRSLGTDYSTQAVASARRLNPHESVYAVAAGNLALDLQFGDVPGPRADLVAARDAYQDAADLGTTNPGAWRGLAIAKFQLGDRHGGIAAARRAVELNRFDPISVELLHSLQSQ